MDKVSVLTSDGTIGYYSTYSAARSAIVDNARDHYVIMIWANLYEEILLLDEVDIWIAPGVFLDRNTAGPTIRDNKIGVYTSPVNCNIYGMGIIKNTYNGGSVYECILITNSNSKISIECDYMEGIGGTDHASVVGPCIYITGGEKFHLKCNRVYNHRNCGLFIGGLSNIIQDINLNIKKIETGIYESSTYYGTSALITHANGFININEIVCSNLGHCYSHRGGNVTARINKMKTINNVQGSHAATVHVPGPTQGTDTQKLILYFDEIQSLRVIEGEGYSSDDGIQLGGGTGIFIGRRTFSTDEYGIEINRTNTKGYVNCNEIISEKSGALGLNDFTGQITIDSNYIEGSGNGETGAIYSSGAANFLLKNAKVVNKNTDAHSRGISLNSASDHLPTVELKDVKIITSETGVIPPYNEIIYVNTGSVDIKNYNLFANRDKEIYITFKVGNFTNFNFIIDILLT